MKKRSLFLSAGIILIIGLVSYIVWQQRNLSYDIYSEYVLLKEKQLLAYIELGKHLDESNNLNQLPVILKMSIENQLIDWYKLSLDNNPIYYYPEGMDQIKLIEKDNYIYGDNNVSYKTIELSDHSLLTIGINKKPEEYFKHTMQKYWKVYLQDLLVPFILAMLVFFYFLKDILNIIKSVSQRQKIGQKIHKLKSKEAEDVIHAVTGFERKVDTLSYQNKILLYQVLPSLRKEVLSGKKPPYEFNCTLVRTDINNFSSLYIQGDKGALLKDVEKLFSKMAHIISRYNGFIHEFIGDEVIFYFKDEDHLNSTAAALACLRDFEISAKKDFNLTTKSSLSYGSLYFSKHLDGYNLSGAVFIETVRILSNVKEKNDFSIHFSESLFPRIPNWVKSEALGEIQLKGYSEKTNIFRVSQFNIIDELLCLNDFKEKIPNLIYYKSMADRETIINWLKHNLDNIFNLDLCCYFKYDESNYKEPLSPNLCQNIKQIITISIQNENYTLASLFIKYLSQFSYSQDMTEEIVNLLSLMISSKSLTIQNSALFTSYILKRDLKIELYLDRIKINSLRSLRWQILSANIDSIKSDSINKILKLIESPKQAKYGYFIAYELIKYWRVKDILHLNTKANDLLRTLSNRDYSKSLLRNLLREEFNKFNSGVEDSDKIVENPFKKLKAS